MTLLTSSGPCGRCGGTGRVGGATAASEAARGVGTERCTVYTYDCFGRLVGTVYYDSPPDATPA